MSSEKDWDFLVCMDHPKVAALKNWHLNYQVLIFIFVFVVDLGLFQLNNIYILIKKIDFNLLNSDYKSETVKY